MNLSRLSPVALVLPALPVLISPGKCKRRGLAGVGRGRHAHLRLRTQPNLPTLAPTRDAAPSPSRLCLWLSRCDVPQHDTGSVSTIGSAFDGAPAGGTRGPATPHPSRFPRDPPLRSETCCFTPESSIPALMEFRRSFPECHPKAVVLFPQ